MLYADVELEAESPSVEFIKYKMDLTGSKLLLTTALFCSGTVSCLSFRIAVRFRTSRWSPTSNYCHCVCSQYKSLVRVTGMKRLLITDWLRIILMGPLTRSIEMWKISVPRVWRLYPSVSNSLLTWHRWWSHWWCVISSFRLKIERLGNFLMFSPRTRQLHVTLIRKTTRLWIKSSNLGARVNSPEVLKAALTRIQTLTPSTWLYQPDLDVFRVVVSPRP